MATKSIPAQEVLRELLNYDPETGALTWRERGPHLFEDRKYPKERIASSWNRRNSGCEFGASKQGYIQGTLGGKKYLAHRLIWKWLYNIEPPEIDHINGDGMNNKLANLRASNRTSNARNQSLSRKNTSTACGVYKTPRGRWYAMIKVNGKSVYLGTFDSVEEASSVRRSKQFELGFTQRHGLEVAHGFN